MQALPAQRADRNVTTSSRPAAEPSSPEWLTPLAAKLEELDGIPRLPRGMTVLSSTQRQALEAVVSNYHRYLAPADRREVAPAVARLFMAFPGERLSRDEAAIRTDAYMIALEGLPLWAVEQAAAWWLRGEKGDGRENYAFCPSPPQLRLLADKAMHAARVRQHEAARVLWAKPQAPEPNLSDEERKRRADKCAELRASLGNGLDMGHRLKRERQALKAKIPASTDTAKAEGEAA